jgi:hypothetical protein
MGAHQRGDPVVGFDAGRKVSNVIALNGTGVRLGVVRCGYRLLACAATTILGIGCAARVYGEPVQGYPSTYEEDAIVYVDTVPPNIEVYPHYTYGGGEAYYVEGRWYRRGPRGWGYYRREPPELMQQRTYVQQAPAAAPREREHERTDVRQAPEVPRERERTDVRQAPTVPHERERTDVGQAPPPVVPRERSETRQAPEPPRPSPGVVEPQPPARAREQPRPPRPPGKHTEEAPPERGHH